VRAQAVIIIETVDQATMKLVIKTTYLLLGSV